MEGLGGAAAYATGSARSVDGTRLMLGHNNGLSITKACSDTWDPDQFLPFPLLGQRLSFTVDLNRVTCGCSLSVYFVLEPGLSEDGAPSQGNCAYSPYYCDASRECGSFCPELDVMEANAHAFQATAHSCERSDAGTYFACDHGGRGNSTKGLPGLAYGPGAEHIIDTTRPFEVHTRFEGSPSRRGAAASLARIDTDLTQGGNRLVLANVAPPAYLAKMAKAMDAGMSLRITYWGDAAAAMTWLDPPSCGLQACDAGGVAELRDFRVTPGRPHRGRTCLTVLLCVGSVVLAAAIWRCRARALSLLPSFGYRCLLRLEGDMFAELRGAQEVKAQVVEEGGDGCWVAVALDAADDGPGGAGSAPEQVLRLLRDVCAALQAEAARLLQHLRSAWQRATQEATRAVVRAATARAPAAAL